jgi:hypothetical protein
VTMTQSVVQDWSAFRKLETFMVGLLLTMDVFRAVQAPGVPDAVDQRVMFAIQAIRLSIVDQTAIAA